MARKRNRKARARRVVKSRLLVAAIELAYGDQYGGREQLEHAVQHQIAKLRHGEQGPPAVPAWWNDQRKASTGLLQRRAAPIHAPELFPFI